MIIEDHVLRIVETNNDDLSAVKLRIEKPLPAGVIENGKITDEISFYELMKQLVKELRIKNRNIRFNVPNPIIIMRQTEVPMSLKSKKEVLEYLEMEIGTTIHLPFQDPIIDALDFKEETNHLETETKSITFFVAPGEEVRKYTEVFIDANLKPISADIGILADYRYIYHTQSLDKHRVYLIIEFNMNAVHLGIFKAHQIEFIRYQELDMMIKKHDADEETEQIKWEYAEDEVTIKGLLEDQINELERIMNFYRFSIHKGEQMVTDIVLLGDNPYLNRVSRMMSGHYEDVSLIQPQEYQAEKTGQTIAPIFIPVLGLALRGGV